MTIAKNKVPKHEQPKPTAGNIILQWLTYAFWGWALLGINWLIFIVVFSSLAHQDQTEVIPYAIAAVLVLLPISVVCDYFYGKQEPAKKSGITMAVMIVHAVIFALFAIGSLIFAVFNLLQLLVSASALPETSVSWAVTLLISAVLYGLTLLRTINPPMKVSMKKLYPLSMIVILTGFLIAAFVGPVSKSLYTRDDRLISNNLYMVVDAIQMYAMNYEKLPNSLNDVVVTDSAADIVDRGLVEYKKEKSVISDSVSEEGGKTTLFHYQLCVTYKESDTTGFVSRPMATDEYAMYIDTGNHPKGQVCYKLAIDSSELKLVR